MGAASVLTMRGGGQPRHDWLRVLLDRGGVGC
jgi:hypothetical protein